MNITGRLAVLCSIIIVLLFTACQESQMSESSGRQYNNAQHWKLGMQAYTFRMYSFYEAVDKTAQLGLHYIEAYPDQKLTENSPEMEKFHHDLSKEKREQIKSKLAASNVKLTSYGVVGLPNNETECRAVFDFAKDMGIPTIISEPPEDAYDLIDRLCIEYKINVAIHNHPNRKKSLYWNPDKVAQVCKGRSKYLGCCSDIGHWMRSSIDPLDALKKLDGRMLSTHFKDIHEFGHLRSQDAVWGTGVADMPAILTELDRQGYQGPIIIEYEHYTDRLMEDLAGCIDYYNDIVNQ